MPDVVHLLVVFSKLQFLYSVPYKTLSSTAVLPAELAITHSVVLIGPRHHTPIAVLSA